jgi:impB/mucB/samB family protein
LQNPLDLTTARSFSTPVTTAARMHEMMAVYAQQAAIQLAKDHQQAKIMTCFAGTSHFNDRASSFPSAAVKLPAPTPPTLFCSPKPPQGHWRGSYWTEFPKHGPE